MADRTVRKQFDEKVNKAGEYWIDRQSASLGNYSGVVAVPGSQNLVYARLNNGQVVKVFNTVAPLIWDWKVYIGKEKSQPAVFKVLESRWIYNISQTAAYILFHHAQHEYPNADTVWIRRDQFMPLLVLPNGGLHIKFFGDTIYTSGMTAPLVVPSQDDIDLTSYQPGSGAVYLLIEVEPDGTLNYITGDTYTSLDLLRAFSNIPTPTVGNFPVCVIELYAGQAEIRRDSTVRNIIDLRLFASSVSDPPGSWHAAAFGTPLDADELGYWDVAAGVQKKITLDDFKLLLESFFDAIYLRKSVYDTDDDGIVDAAAAAALASDLDIGSLTEELAPTTGDMFVMERSGARYRVDSDNLPGGGGGEWTQVINESGDSFANFTAVSGTWASDGTIIKQTNTTAGVARFTNKIITASMVAQMDVQLRGTGDIHGAMILGFDGSSTNGSMWISAREGSNNIAVVIDGAGYALNIPATIDSNTWYTLKAVLFGTRVSIYLDGTLLGTYGGNNTSLVANASYFGLVSVSVEAWFRNIKVWVPTLPA